MLHHMDEVRIGLHTRARVAIQQRHIHRAGRMALIEFGLRADVHEELKVAKK